MLLAGTLGDLLTQFSYAGVALAVALSGYLIPVPEEVALLLVGYLAASGVNNVWLAGVVSFISVFASDYAGFFFARVGAALVRVVGGRFSEQRLTVFERRMREHAGKTIFTLRFAAGLRFLSMFLAGTLGVSPVKFLLYDALALAIYVPLYIFLGYRFHATIATVLVEVTAVRHVVSLVVLGLGGVLLVLIVRKLFWRRVEHKARL